MAQFRTRFKGARFCSFRDALREGSVTLEIALLSPIFFLFLIGVMELCLIEGAQQILEAASYNASRLAKTGHVATGKTQEQTVMQVLIDELSSYGFLLNPNKVTMTRNVYSSFYEANQNGGASTSAFGTEKQIVGYRFVYPWNVFTPLMCSVLGGVCELTTEGYIMNLSTTIVVRNEPYG